MSSLPSNVARFIQMLSSGQSEKAMSEFYHDEVLVFENRTLARAGKHQCLEYERQQLAAQPVAPHFKVGAHAINEHTGHVFLQYTVRFTDPRVAPCASKKLRYKPGNATRLFRNASTTTDLSTRETPRKTRNN